MLNAIQQRVNASDARSVFDAIDDNLSGRVSPDELAKALSEMGMVIDERACEEVIRSINERHGSRRKALTYDIFCQTFKKYALHGTDPNVIQLV